MLVLTRTLKITIPASDSFERLFSPGKILFYTLDCLKCLPPHMKLTVYDVQSIKQSRVPRVPSYQQVSDINLRALVVFTPPTSPDGDTA